MKRIRGNVVLFRRKTSARELSVFCKQLSILLSAGVVVAPALETLGSSQKDRAFGADILSVMEAVKQGSSLSEAARRFPKSFPPLFLQMVRTAETGGDTVKILENLSVYYANQAQLKSQVFHAFLYPTIVAGVALAVIIFLLTTVMPIFVEIITAMGSEIPPTTAVLLAISSGAAYVLPILLLIIILGVLLARLFRERVPSLEKFQDRIFLHLPVMGKITSYREWLRLTDALEILLSNGVNLLYALEVAGGVTENRHLQLEMAKLQDGVRSGHALSDSLAKASVFDQNFYQMVRVGESSGTMADVLGKISLYYRDELDRWIKTVTTIMEPAVLIAVGLVVMFIVVSVMSPIYTIYEGYIQLM